MGALAVPSVLIVQIKPKDLPPAPFAIADAVANETAANATMTADNAAIAEPANDSNVTANVDAAANTADTENAADQGSTDHGSTDH